MIKSVSPVLLLGVLFVASTSQSQELEITLDPNEIVPEGQIAVSVSLLNNGDGKGHQFPKGYASARTRYVACVAGTPVQDSTETPAFPELGPSMPYPDRYCNQRTQRRVFLGKVEDATDIASGGVTLHKFQEKLVLPKNPLGTYDQPYGPDIWIIVRISYRPPRSDNPRVLFGWTRVTFTCKQGQPQACTYISRP